LAVGMLTVPQTAQVLLPSNGFSIALLF